MTNEIMVVKQLPIIEQKLLELKAEIQQKVDIAVSLDCTEDNYKAIKKVRSALSKEFTELETARKGVKKKVMEPYEQFEAIYKECVTDLFKEAKQNLDSKIGAVESALLEEKENKAVEYFKEYAESLHIDFVEFENVGVTVNMSISLKKLKEACKAFLDKVNDDLALIDTQEHKDETLVEYKQSLNASRAITTVTARHRAIEEENRRRKEAEERARAEAERQAVIDAVIAESAEAEAEIEQNIFMQPDETMPEEPLAAPTVEAIPVPERKPAKCSLCLRLTATKADIQSALNFFKERGITYEQL